MSNSSEHIIGVYGYECEGITMTKETATKFAQLSKGMPYGLNLKIVSVRLEDDSPSDPTKGRVIATCEPLQDSSKPYKPKNMEYK